MHSRVPQSGLALLISSMLLTALPVGAAQKTEFNPAVALEAGYTDNVSYSSEETTSDTVARVTLELPVATLWKTGSLNLTYKPSYWSYADQSELNRFEHRARIGLESNLTRQSRLNFATGYTQTQAQVNPERQFEVDPDQILTQRTTRKNWAGELKYRHDPSKRWYYEARLNGAIVDHEKIEGYDEPGTGLAVEDRTDYGGSFHASWHVSRKDEIGGRYEHREFSLERSGDESTDLLSLTYSRSLSRRSSLGFIIGGYNGEGEAAGPEGERSGYHGAIRYERAYDKYDMEATLRHEPTSGGHATGTSTNTTASFSVSGLLPTSKWNWRTGIRAQYREPSDPTQDNLTSAGVSARIERLFTHTWGVRVGLGYINQSQPDDESTTEPSVFTFNAGVVWYPKGRATSLGERESL